MTEYELSQGAMTCLRRLSPLTTDEIAHGLLGSGYRLEGPEETQCERLAALLFDVMRRRSRRFRRVGGHLWALTVFDRNET